EKERVLSVLSSENIPSDPVIALMGGSELSYHTLVRSCITQALLTLDLGMERIYQRHNLGPRTRIDVAPEEIPEFIDDLPDATRGKMVSMMPSALYWVAKHQNVIPAKSYQILEDAGLLMEGDGGEPLRYRYAATDMTPYGMLRINTP
ncbi:MAG: hypothetical protein AAF191_20435, partial [Verrucomicrobiota bacterium]